MLCCLNPSQAYSPIDTNKPREKTSQPVAGISHFPGQRRAQIPIADPVEKQLPPNRTNLIKTAGNALVEYEAPVSSYQKENVSVTLPEGVSPGQTIHVASPDGTGRTVPALVPNGMKAGSTFVVEFPPDLSLAVCTPSTGHELVDTSLEKNEGPYSSNGAANMPQTPLASPSVSCNSQPQAESAIASANVATLSHPFNPPKLEQSQKQQQELGGKRDCQSLMLVKVPPGTAPGSTIHVQVPGDRSRTLAAVIPAGNVSKFYVAYQTKREQEQESQKPTSAEGLLL